MMGAGDAGTPGTPLEAWQRAIWLPAGVSTMQYSTFLSTVQYSTVLRCLRIELHRCITWDAGRKRALCRHKSHQNTIKACFYLTCCEEMI